MDLIEEIDKYFLYGYIDELDKRVCVIKKESPQYVKDIMKKRYDIVEYE